MTDGTRPGARALFALLVAVGCGKPEAEPKVGTTDRSSAAAYTGRPVAFTFDSLDARPVSSEACRGKPTLIAFVTTGDILCQAQVDYLVAMAKNDGAAINYVLVAIHPRKEIVLVDTYVRTLGVTFPAALADPAATSGAGPFGDIPAVPTLVLLNRAGALVWKHTGLAKSDELRAHLRGI